VSFLNPVYLPILILVPVLALLYLLAQRRRSSYAVRFTNLDLLASVVGKRPGLRRHVPTALFLLGLTGLVLAAADPVLNLEVARSRASVMLVIDVSGSMDATDVFPSRLVAARSAARQLIDQLPPGAEVGLVSFNTNATLLTPLTTNHDNVTSALDSLRANGGTAIGEGITAAQKYSSETPPFSSTSMRTTIARRSTSGSTSWREALPRRPRRAGRRRSSSS